VSLEILSTFSIKNMVFRDVTPCCFSDLCRRFGGTCCHYFICQTTWTVSNNPGIQNLYSENHMRFIDPSVEKM